MHHLRFETVPLGAQSICGLGAFNACESGQLLQERIFAALGGLKGIQILRFQLIKLSL